MLRVLYDIHSIFGLSEVLAIIMLCIPTLSDQSFVYEYI